MPEPRTPRPMPGPRGPHAMPDPDPDAETTMSAEDATPEPRAPRAMPGPRVPRPMPEPRGARAKPDPKPLRLLLGLTGIASASAITTALLPSIAPATQAVAVVADVTSNAAVPSVQHVIKYVTLQPGQTAPPQASVIVNPTPSPRVTVVTVTQQSGKP